MGAGNSAGRNHSILKMKLLSIFHLQIAVAALACVSLNAADLSSAEIIQVVKEVRILPSGGSPVAASVGTSISGSTAVTTGRRSRAELEFNDQTLMRIGSNTTFSIAGGRAVELERGALLLQTPDGGGRGSGVQVRAGNVTAAITGSMGFVSLSEPTERSRQGEELFFKFISIHGDMNLEMEGKVFDLKPFQLLFLRLDPEGNIIGEPSIKTIDGEKLVETSELVQGFDDDSRLRQLPIGRRIAGQTGEKKQNNWTAVTSNSQNRVPELFRKLTIGRNAITPPPPPPPAPTIFRPRPKPKPKPKPVFTPPPPPPAPESFIDSIGLIQLPIQKNTNSG